MSHSFLSSQHLLPGVPKLLCTDGDCCLLSARLQGFPSALPGWGMLPSHDCPGSYLGDQSLVLCHELVQVFLVLVDAFQEVGSLVLQLVQLLIHLREDPRGHWVVNPKGDPPHSTAWTTASSGIRCLQPPTLCLHREKQRELLHICRGGLWDPAPFYDPLLHPYPSIKPPGGCCSQRGWVI